MAGNPFSEMTPGVFKIKRGAGAADPYTVEELDGYQLTGANEVDLLDTNLSVYYESFDAVMRLKDVHTTAKLNQDIASGAIVIAEEIPPAPGAGAGP